MGMQQKVHDSIDADIEAFFDHIDHKWLMKCLSERISDPQFKRLLWKFLKSGVMKQGEYHLTDEGTPQGGSISPIRANIYLHYILDVWMEGNEKKKRKGYVKLLRYADDFISGLQYKKEAETLLKEIQERLDTFGVKLSLEKTKIIACGRFAAENRKRRGRRKPETFTFLGFTHDCSTTQDGRFRVKVKTNKKQLKAAIEATTAYRKTHRTKQLETIWDMLKLKLTGHDNYYGISGNIAQMEISYHKVRARTFKWLNSRSDRKSFTWEEFAERIRSNPLPLPKITYVLYNTW